MQVRQQAVSRNEGLVERMKTLAERHGPAEISRRTETPLCTVMRYVKGARVPAEFCSSLVEAFGVNPAWLLAGEGSVYLADVHSDMKMATGDLLELVNALNSVAKMRLGSLVGNEQRTHLRELNDALLSYQELREKLNLWARPVFRDLLDRLWKVLITFDEAQASGLIEALKQISRICDDEALCTEFWSAQGTYEARCLRTDLAEAPVRRALFMSLARKTMPEDKTLVLAFNFATTLASNGRLRDARRFALMAASTAGPKAPGRGRAIYHALHHTAGWHDVLLGRLQRGLARMQRASPYMDPGFLHRGGSSAHEVTYILAGLRSFEDVASSSLKLAQPLCHRMINYATMSEVPAHLRRAIELYSGPGIDRMPATDSIVMHATALLEALERPSGAWKAQAFENAWKAAEAKAGESPQARVHVAVAQIARLRGDTATAARALKHSRDAIKERYGSTAEAGVFLLAMHYRNALALPLAKADRAWHLPLMRQARRYFRVMVQRGYACLLGDARKHGLAQ